MRIINTQKKLCNRVFTNQADLALFYDAFKNNFQQFSKFLKIKTHFLAKDGAFPTPGESIRRGWGELFFSFFQYATSSSTALANNWLSLLNCASSKNVFTLKHTLKSRRSTLEPQGHALQSPSRQFVFLYRQTCETIVLS